MTRGELRGELASFATKAELREEFPTKADLRGELASFATKAELREEFPTKADLRTELASFATKAELREEFPTKADLRAELANYSTKADLRAELANYPTKADLRAELANYPTKADLRAELANYPTKAEMRDEFPTKHHVNDMGKTFVDALVRLEERTDRKFEKVYAAIAQLSLDMTRNMNVMVEAIRSEIRAVTEPYQDHGPRIEKLERAVFPEDGGKVRAKARVRRRTRPR